jgi:hypothetical protein
MICDGLRPFAIMLPLHALKASVGSHSIANAHYVI